MINNKITKFLLMALVLIIAPYISYGQSKQEKIETIIKKLHLVDTQKTYYDHQIRSLKYQATEKDSIRIIELEKQLSEEKMIDKYVTAFNNSFTIKEIDETYAFVKITAFNKFFENMNNIIGLEFEEIDKEIEEITESIRNTSDINTEIFAPIPVDREDGFYEIFDYNSSTIDKDIKLKEKPSLTPIDILKAERYFGISGQPELSILLTKQGARKLSELTRKNIGRPIAIVINKKIISLPIVNTEITGNAVNVSGQFTVQEVDEMIKLLTTPSSVVP